MKDFLLFSIFAAFYILIIILFQASAQSTGSPLLNGGGKQNESSGVLQELFPSMPSLASASLDRLGISDPAVRQTVANIYGTIIGQPDCVKKSICIMGNYFHDLPGRDAIFMLLARYVPPEWGLLYDIFRVSVMYGQNCEVYICNPNSTDPKITATPPPPVILTTQVPPQQPSTPAPEFDNFIHKNF